MIRNSAVASFLIFLGIFFLPVYTFSSGGIQPAHYILFIFSVFVLLNNSLKISGWLLLFFSFLIYSFLVESYYFVISGNPKALIHPVFLLYNLVLVSAVFTYCLRFGLLGFTTSIGGAAILCLIAIFVFGDAGQIRVTGTFNNPNQLGYFSTCLLSLGYLFRCHKVASEYFSFIIIVIAIILSILSLSKAAMIANFLVLLFVFRPMLNGRTSWLGLCCWVSFLVVFVVALFYSYTVGVFDNYLFVARLDGMLYENDSSAEARGYYAILEASWLQLVFGLGYDNVLTIVGHEVHSTLGSAINVTGIVGFLLLSAVFSIWVVELWRAYGFLGMCCLCGPAMLYGLTHNGMRFTIFWVLFGASMAMAYRVRQSRKVCN